MRDSKHLSICEEAEMTTDLKSMTVEELRRYAYLTGEINERWLARHAFDELARRLEEAQEKIKELENEIREKCSR